ncbi:FecR family protein [Filimonas effusa]|uniref:DUF4974 domain-containing protein n=1 Tax=Filimonas effusa TaxID=2508721 RepID=A0A4Q1D9Y7_9BACT|nr:FecR domain-containing protein [Filimonas effusa]RXK86040.1 DUF4974 domain-containing protein [Filimonas effusa]
MQQNPVYSVYDLIANGSFKKWILYQDEKEGLYWHNWIAENPDKLEWVAVAKSMVLLLNSHTHAVGSEEVDAEAASIMLRLDEEKETEALYVPSIWSRAGTWVAAAVLLLMLTAMIYLLTPSVEPSDYKSLPVYNNKLVFENSGDSVLRVALPDGSRVLLEKNARLQYADDDSLKQRVALLSGDAFFDIAHNPSHPFVVYTSSIVTHVLGTSFWVKASPGITTSSAIVRTGKVAVFRKEDYLHRSTSSGILQGVVLSANQQVSYDIAHDRVYKALAADPHAASPDADTILNLDAQPAVAVFEQLEALYGIPIIVDKQTLAGCAVTAVLGNESFYEKITTICKILNASYEIIDGTIVINSKGCK